MVLDKKMESVVVSVRGTLSIKVSNTQRATINTHSQCMHTLVLHSQCTYIHICAQYNILKLYCLSYISSNGIHRMH